jgi:hypothetical protein
MSGRPFVRTLYSWASGVPAFERPLEAVRSHPRVRRFARRHVDVLLARGTTWANVDGALRLLAEDQKQEIAFGRWPGDAATELLYWAPFVRWAQEHFSFDPARVVVFSRSGAGYWYGDGLCAVDAAGDPESLLQGASIVRPGPVAALVDEYRAGSAAARPLLKRSKHILLRPPVATDSDGGDAYLAVDLGPSAAFPESDANERAAATLRDALSASTRVVALDRTRPVAEQHAVLAGASGLVAGYAGSAVLAGFSGVPVVALRSSDGVVAEPDLDLAQRVTSRLGGSLTILDAGDVARLHDAIGGR